MFIILFSQRKGYKPVNSVMQYETMDDDLRIKLWNCFTSTYLPPMYVKEDKNLYNFIRKLWCGYFKGFLEELNGHLTTESIKLKIKQKFFKYEWYEVYDFLEFTVNNYTFNGTISNPINILFMEACNDILEKENSAYRFIDDKIAEITSKEEIFEIEEVLEKSSLEGVKVHLKRALELCSDKKNPDYRNSIKESISAVESISKLISNNPKKTLGDALNVIEKSGKVRLHKALTKGFSNIYGYTNDADGIRHALLDETNLNSEDAKFMLVACSAFINYLRVKAEKAGIELK